LPDGRIATAIGAEVEPMGCVAAAVGAAALRAAWHSHAGFRLDPAKLLKRVNDTLWQLSTGPQQMALLDGRIAPDTGDYDLAAAGNINALVIGKYGFRPIASAARPLGTEPDVRPATHQGRLQPGEVLCLTSASVLADQTQPESGRITQSELAGAVQSHLPCTAEEIMAAVRRSACRRGSIDRTILLLKRQGG
jgi:phosphoserine phosphatase RsbU/P